MTDPSTVGYHGLKSFNLRYPILYDWFRGLVCTALASKAHSPKVSDDMIWEYVICLTLMIYTMDLWLDAIISEFAGYLTDSIPGLVCITATISTDHLVARLSSVLHFGLYSERLYIFVFGPEQPKQPH
jgi:hypothetical protein